MSSERRWLLALLLAAFGLRAAYCVFASSYDWRGPIPDIDHYQRFAHSLKDRWAMELGGKPSANREPGYPVFLAALYSVTGARFPALWLAHCLLEVLTIWLILILGTSIFSRNVGWAAAVMAAAYPQFLYYCATPRRETFMVFGFAAAVWATLRACRGPSWKRMAAAGAVWAGLVLTNSVFLPTGMAACAGVWLLTRRGAPANGNVRAARWSAIFLIAYLSLYALWPLRNYAVFGRFIAGITAGGAHIYTALIVPNWASGTEHEARFVEADPVMKKAGTLPEDRKDAYFYKESAKWIARHPVRFTGIVAASGIKLWRLYPYKRDYGRSYAVILAVSLLSDGWMIPLGLLGLILAWRRFPETDLINLVLFSTTLTYMIFWSVVRYRLPMMPLVLLYAAYALERGVVRFAPGRLPFPASKEAA